MAALAVNLIALLIVVGMCWVAMMWLSGRFHGHGSEFEYESVQYRGSTRIVRKGRIDARGADDQVIQLPVEPPCAVCEGVGAHNDHGKLAPCPECYGTGVLTQ